MASSAELAPVAIFAYRRTDHLAELLSALEACPEFGASPVFIFSDGPKSSDDRGEVEAVRGFIKKRLRLNMTLIEAPSNLGIYRSIVGGVTKLCEEYGRVIVIEDDLVVSPVALTWFNLALRKFADAEKVWQIAAHQHPVPEYSNYACGLFLPLTTSWGWATWKRAWDHFDPEVTGWDLLRADPDLRHRFDVNSAYPYVELMEAQLEQPQENWDWDIRFWWSVFRADGVTLFPPRSLVENIGFDSSATHHRMGWLRKHFRRKQRDRVDRILPQMPTQIATAPHDLAALSRALKKSRTLVQKRPWLRNALRRIQLYP
jgi:GT2 family glycosyltransferase